MAEVFEIRSVNVLHNLINRLQSVDFNNPIKVTIANLRYRGISANAQCHVWYAGIAKFLISQGRTEIQNKIYKNGSLESITEKITPESIKRSLKDRFLGWETVTRTDKRTREPMLKMQLVETSKLDSGEHYWYMQEIKRFCDERLDYIVPTLKDAQYEKWEAMENST